MCICLSHYPNNPFSLAGGNNNANKQNPITLLMVFLVNRLAFSTHIKTINDIF